MQKLQRACLPRFLGKLKTFFFFFLEEITDFPLTDGEDQIAKIVELLKFSGDQLEREVQSFLNERDFFLRPHTSP